MVNPRIAIVIWIGAIWGCAAQPEPILTPVEVQVPSATPVYCEVSKLDKPALPLATLNTQSPPADTIRAYAATVALLKGAVQERDSELAGCADPAATNAAPQNPAEKAK